MLSSKKTAVEKISDKKNLDYKNRTILKTDFNYVEEKIQDENTICRQYDIVGYAYDILTLEQFEEFANKGGKYIPEYIEWDGILYKKSLTPAEEQKSVKTFYDERLKQYKEISEKLSKEFFKQSKQ